MIDKIATCIVCGKKRRVPGNANSKFCRPCYQIRLQEQRKVRNANREKSKGKGSQPIPYIIVQKTEQFSRGAEFSTVDVDMMLMMGTILEGTILSREGRYYRVVNRDGHHKETLLQRKGLIPHDPAIA